MELTERIREILRKEYQINTDEELLAEIEKQKTPDIGIFVSSCGMERELCGNGVS